MRTATSPFGTNLEGFFSRNRNASVLVFVIFAQVLGLGVQKRAETGGTRLIRLWVVSAITPLEKALVDTNRGVRNVWNNYLYLRGVRRENRELKAQIERLRVEQVRLSEDAAQARRLQALLGFKEKFVSQTLAAQVIGSSGSDQSHVIYIDKGTSDGVKPDMAVITPDGIVGKILRVFHNSSQVLLINDSSSGVGAILESSRLQGILQGTATGETMLRYVMGDEKVAPGERVLTSGGDRIFPKGLPIGTVQQADPGNDLFLNVRVKPGANLSRLEEVLVVTRLMESSPQGAEPSRPMRAADVLAERLPKVPPKTATSAGPSAGGTPTASTTKPPNAAPNASNSIKPSDTHPSGPVKPLTAGTASVVKPPANAAKPSAPNSEGVRPPANATKPATKPSGTIRPVETAAPAGSSPNPAVAKPGGDEPAGRQAVKPAAPGTQTPPSEEVPR